MKFSELISNAMKFSSLKSNDGYLSLKRIIDDAGIEFAIKLIETNYIHSVISSGMPPSFGRPRSITPALLPQFPQSNGSD